MRFSEDLGKGPLKDRKCTDILFMFVFITFLCGMAAAAIYGWVRGNPKQLLIGWDSD